MTSPHIMLVAGEPSSDALGGQLIAAMRDQLQGHTLSLSGVGGAAMMAQGLDPLYPIDDIAVIGLAQTFPRLPKLFDLINQAVDHALAVQPDAVVLIDSSAFNNPIAKRLKKRGYKGPIIKYVAPQVWASRPGRAKKMAHYIDHVLTLFPFEPPYFEKEGIEASFIGHPIMERPVQKGQGPAFRAAHHIAPDAPLLVMLPGSRVNEVKYLLPIFCKTLRQLGGTIEGLRVVVPLTANLSKSVKDKLAQENIEFIYVENEIEKFAAFDAADAALAASGSVSLELARAECPMVIGYRLGWFTGPLFLKLIQIPFLTLTNIILEREAIPEFIQNRCTASNLAKALLLLLLDDTARQAQRKDLGKALALLTQKGSTPSQTAARKVLELAGAV